MTAGDKSAPKETPIESIKQSVLAAVQDFSAATAAGDVERQLAFYSEEWQGDSGRTKADLRASYREQDQQASSGDKRLVLDDAKVVVEGDTAIIDPITTQSSIGGGFFLFKMKRETDGEWRCVSTTGSRHGDIRSEQARSTVRERILSDPARPAYHFVVPEGIAIPFDPNGAIYWKGRYHLFYIFQDTQLGKRSDHWGHMSSTDLFHWRHHPTGLLEGMYSGNCFINEDGVPTICYHQVGQGNAMAVALDDDLNEWKKLDSNPITPKTREGDEHHEKYRSWDPHGWLEGDTYYAIFGGKRPGVAKSPALEGEWKVRWGPVRPRRRRCLARRGRVLSGPLQAGRQARAPLHQPSPWLPLLRRRLEGREVLSRVPCPDELGRQHVLRAGKPGGTTRAGGSCGPGFWTGSGSACVRNTVGPAP